MVHDSASDPEDSVFVSSALDPFKTALTTEAVSKWTQCLVFVILDQLSTEVQAHCPVDNDELPEFSKTPEKLKSE